LTHSGLDFLHKINNVTVIFNRCLERESSAMFERKEDPWSLLLKILHTSRLRDHTDQKLMFQLFIQVNDSPASWIDILKQRKKEILYTFFLSLPSLELHTYKTPSQRATIGPCWLNNVCCLFWKIEATEILGSTGMSS
jgi:hypothetical protein